LIIESHKDVILQTLPPTPSSSDEKKPRKKRALGSSSTSIEEPVLTLPKPTSKTIDCKYVSKRKDLVLVISSTKPKKEENRLQSTKVNEGEKTSTSTSCILQKPRKKQKAFDEQNTIRRMSSSEDIPSTKSSKKKTSRKNFQRKTKTVPQLEKVTKERMEEEEGEEEEENWVFHCMCGVSDGVTNKDPEYLHPTGRMFECSRCKSWGHTDCYPEYACLSEFPEEMYCHNCNPTKPYRIQKPETSQRCLTKTNELSINSLIGSSID
jgi:hypothetical protein